MYETVACDLFVRDEFNINKSASHTFWVMWLLTFICLIIDTAIVLV